MLSHCNIRRQDSSLISVLGCNLGGLATIPGFVAGLLYSSEQTTSHPGSSSSPISDFPPSSVQTDHHPALQQPAVHTAWGTEGPAVGGVQRARRRIAAMKVTTLLSSSSATILTSKSSLDIHNEWQAARLGGFWPISQE